MVVLSIVTGLMFVLLVVMFAHGNGITATVVFGMALLFYSICVGVYFSEDRITKQSKYKKTPTIKVECLGNKCDTTYIYKF